MARTVLLVGTRKGCFMLESDGERKDWHVRGPYCEGWPIYHAIHDSSTGALYAAAASEWHGAGVWRSNDLGETWELSSEGLTYGEGELKLSKISGLTAAHGRVLAGERRQACSRAATAASPGRSSARSTASPAATPGTTRPTSPRAISACRRSSRTRTTRPTSGRSCRASASSRQRTTAARGRRATRACAPTGRSRIPPWGTACTSS